ncbi:MAG TPA: sigma-70 family RNA polymerase sigma factor [Candidatus Limnocylindrales bacterium]
MENIETSWEGAMRMEALAVGDAEAERREAFDRFTQSRLDRAYRLAGLILRDPSAAEDAVHDAAVQAWLHWGELRDHERLDAWFDRILVNGCRAQLRRRTMRAVDLDARRDLPGPDALAGLDDRDVLHRALATLDADHRIAVVLRYIEELSPAEIAALTGDREGTVKSRLHYALRQMRAAMDAAERMEGTR